MSNRFLLIACGALGVLIGVLALPPLTAEDQQGNGAAPAGAAAAYRLAYKFQTGDVVRYESVQKSKFVSQFKGNAETSTNETHMRKAYRVVKVYEDGTADLETIIEWVRMKVDFGDGSLPTEFDSKDPASKTQAKFADVSRNIGKPQVRMRTSSTGKVLKVKEVAPVGPAPAGAQIQMKDVQGQDSYDFLTIFPAKALKVGEGWEDKSEVQVADNNLKKTVDVKTTYTLKAVDGDLATVGFKTVVLTPIRDNNIAIQLMQREPSGELVFDMRKGAVVTRSVTHDKSVINPAGNNTAMNSKGVQFERLVSETAAISDIETDKTKK